MNKCELTAVLLAGILVVAAAPAARADPVPQDAYFNSLSIGDTEAATLHTMGVAATEIRRRSVAGVSYTIMVFDLGKARYTLTFTFGRLVAKAVEARPATAGFSLF